MPQIRIDANGQITPQTDLVSRNGATYNLNQDLNGTQIVIECSNIVFDGNGHSITLTNSGSNPGIHISYCINTTIKNVQINTPLYTSITMYGCSDCQITGTKNSGHIDFGMSSNNAISKNTGPILINYGSQYNQIISNNVTSLAISYFPGQNIIYGNNLLFETKNPPYVASRNVWNNSSRGNYWSTYTSVYPNASEVGQTGIGDTPYVLDADNIDHYPVMYPFDIENEMVVLPSREPPSQLFFFLIQ